MPNMYYSPDDFGLTLVTTFNRSEPDYSFDFVCVWHNEDGYYIAGDSGCSCPSPFEQYTSVDQLEGPLDFSETVAAIASYAQEAWNPEYAQRGSVVAIENMMWYRREIS